MLADAAAMLTEVLPNAAAVLLHFAAEFDPLCSCHHFSLLCFPSVGDRVQFTCLVLLHDRMSVTDQLGELDNQRTDIEFYVFSRP